MTEKEQEVLDMYLKDLKKKRIIAVFLIICIVVIGLSYAKNFMKNNNQVLTLIENTIEENIINEVKTNNDIETKEEVIKENKVQNEITNIVTESNESSINPKIEVESKKENENTR